MTGTILILVLSMTTSLVIHQFVLKKKGELIKKIFSEYTFFAMLLFVAVGLILATSAEKLYKPTKTVALAPILHNTAGNVWYETLSRGDGVAEFYLIHVPKEPYPYQVYEKKDVKIKFENTNQPILQEETAIAFKNPVYNILFPSSFLKLDGTKYTLRVPLLTVKESV
jgi:hypothetical protein